MKKIIHFILDQGRDQDPDLGPDQEGNQSHRAGEDDVAEVAVDIPEVRDPSREKNRDPGVNPDDPAEDPAHVQNLNEAQNHPEEVKKGMKRNPGG